jgi:hypothetical protein
MGATAPFFIAMLQESPSMVHPIKGRVDVQSKSSSSQSMAMQCFNAAATWFVRLLRSAIERQV